MQLGVHRDPAVAQSLDEVPLPQRALGGQAGAVQPRDELEQLAHPARLGQRAVADVVLDVELVVLHPHPLAGGLDRPVRVLEEQRRDVGGVARLLEQVADVVAAGALGLLVELEPAHVHRHAAVLGQQEAQSGRIERGHHPAILGPRGVGSPPLVTWHDRRHGGPGQGGVARQAVEPRAHLAADSRDRADRWQSKSWQIGQCAIAAGVAWFIAHDVVGHADPVLRADRGGGEPRYVVRAAPAPGRGGDRRRGRRGVPRRPDRGGHRLGLVAADGHRGARDVDGGAARRRPAVHDAGGGAVDRGRDPASPTPAPPSPAGPTR